MRGNIQIKKFDDNHFSNNFNKVILKPFHTLQL